MFSALDYQVAVLLSTCRIAPLQTLRVLPAPEALQERPRGSGVFAVRGLTLGGGSSKRRVAHGGRLRPRGESSAGPAALNPLKTQRDPDTDSWHVARMNDERNMTPRGQTMMIPSGSFRSRARRLLGLSS